MTGEGIDFYVKNLRMKLLYLQCEKQDHIGVGFSGLGIYKDHIHGDTSNRRVTRWVCREGVYTYLF